MQPFDWQILETKSFEWYILKFPHKIKPCLQIESYTSGWFLIRLISVQLKSWVNLKKDFWAYLIGHKAHTEQR